jgi:hypothetical protein
MPWDAGLVVGALLGYRSAMTFANLITMGIADPGLDPMLNRSASLPPSMIY